MTCAMIAAAAIAAIPITFLICALIHRWRDRQKIVGYFGKRPVVNRYLKREWPYKPEGYWPPNYWM